VNPRDVGALLKIHEGLRLKPYADTVGKITIGYGRNLDARGITRETAEAMLAEDIAHATNGARKYTWFEGLSDVRQAVVVDMIVNLGRGGFRRFIKMKRALLIKNYDRAAHQMADSKWYRQVGRRGVRLRKMMETNQWPSERDHF
jgi:lysozyme